MGNVFFIVWRESLEAVLIIGILYSFLSRRPESDGGKSGLSSRPLHFMWAGVLGGILLSMLLGLATMKVQDSLSGQALEYFQTAILIFSAFLMTQMVVWMNVHGRKMKKALESDLTQAMTTSGLWGVALVSMFAVAREGTETVVYLYGLSLEHATSGMGIMGLAAFGGFAFALLTAWTVSKGIRFLHYGTFFKLTSLVLLFSAAGLMVAGTNRLIEMDVLPAIVDPLWNTSWLLDASTMFGGIVAAFTGYRSNPSLMLVLMYAGYWIFAGLWMKRAAQRATA